jgi:hypothetical protein
MGEIDGSSKEEEGRAEQARPGGTDHLEGPHQGRDQEVQRGW